MTPIRFILLGGFLGAGKSTALLRLARSYAAEGKRVGLITNDQAEGLVDTAFFRAHGLVTEEIPRGCFCCKFDTLIEAAGRLADGHQPDVLLAEPVGSCTDLVNAVITPLKELYAGRFSVAPYAALLDPERAIQALGGKGPCGFSAKVVYIYTMQQNEADIIAINKCDTLNPERLDFVRELARRNFPNAELLAVSAKTGEGFEQFRALLDASAEPGRNPIDVDYDVYGEGESALGWLNATGRVHAESPFALDAAALALGEALRAQLFERRAEPAHVKLILQDGGRAAVVNLTGRGGAVLSQPAAHQSAFAELVVNGRVEMDPDALRAAFDHSIARVQSTHTLSFNFDAIHHLAPAPPTPPKRR